MINWYRPWTGVVGVLIPFPHVIVLPNPESQLVFVDQNVFKLGHRTLVFRVIDHTYTEKINATPLNHVEQSSPRTKIVTTVWRLHRGLESKAND